MNDQTIRKLVVLGASNGFWEINELVRDINEKHMTYSIIAVLDDNPKLRGSQMGDLRVQGPLSDAAEFGDDVRFVFAIGSYKTRMVRHEVLRRLSIPDERFETLVHPTAKVFSNAVVGHGCIIHYGTVIFNHCLVEAFSVISANCVIGVRNVIGRGALLGSNVTTTTGVFIGAFGFVGSSVTIAENVTIEAGAQVGMGTTIYRDVATGTFVLGTPAKILDRQEVPEEITNAWNQTKQKHRN